MNSQSGRISGKAALITGGASGIGLATAKRFVEEGALVTITDRDVQGGERAADAMGDRCRFVQHDVTDEAGWDVVVADCVKAHGRLDILVNSAGIFRKASIEHTTLNEWRDTIAVNLEGTFLGCRAAIRVMKAEGGAIVNLSSVGGIFGDADYPAYCVSKGGVRLLSKSVAVYCTRERYNIRCNSVLPGSIDTPMGGHMTPIPGDRGEPIPRYGQPEEVASLILFLASDEASYTNGAEVTIDDGDSAGFRYSYRRAEHRRRVELSTSQPD